MKHSYHLIDVFTDSPYNGAQLAVFPEAGELSSKQMQKIAGELNYTETAFISGSEQANEFNVRVFSPSAERGFSGHGTVAIGFVLAKFGLVELQENRADVCLKQNSGEVQVVITRRNDDDIFVQFSRTGESTVDRYVPDNAQLAEMLTLEENEIAKGRYNTLLVAVEQPYLIVPLKSFESVRKAVFNLREWSTSVAPVSPANEILLFSTKSELSTSNFHARLVGPQIGIDEDPPIASTMPAFAGYLSAHEHIKLGTYSFVIDRGTLATRKSVLSVELVSRDGAENEIRVGGPAVVVGEGSVIAP